MSKACKKVTNVVHSTDGIYRAGGEDPTLNDFPQEIWDSLDKSKGLDSKDNAMVEIIDNLDFYETEDLQNVKIVVELIDSTASDASGALGAKNLRAIFRYVVKSSGEVDNHKEFVSLIKRIYDKLPDNEAKQGFLKLVNGLTGIYGIKGTWYHLDFLERLEREIPDFFNKLIDMEKMIGGKRRFDIILEDDVYTVIRDNTKYAFKYFECKSGSTGILGTSDQIVWYMDNLANEFTKLKFVLNSHELNENLLLEQAKYLFEEIRNHSSATDIFDSIKLPSSAISSADPLTGKKITELTDVETGWLNVIKEHFFVEHSKQIPVKLAQ